MNRLNIACLCGFVVGLVGLAVGGYRISSYDTPVERKDFITAFNSRVSDKPLMLLNAAMQEIARQDADKAKEFLSSAYEACLDEDGTMAAARKPLAATIKFRQANLLVEMQDIQGAIESYCESLRLEPNNLDAKYNLELLLLRTGGGGSGKPKIVPGSGQSRDQGI